MNPWSDDVEANGFTFSLRVRPEASDYVLYYSSEVSNETFVDLIKSNQAEIVLHIESADSFYRSYFAVPYSKETQEVRIGADHLHGKITVSPFICAKSDIPDYKNCKQHADYQNRTFSVKKSDYLAICKPFTFLAEKDYDPLKNLSSFIKIARSPDAIDKPANISYSGHVVQILLPNKTYELFGTFKDNSKCRATVTTLLVLPALVFLVNLIRTNTDTTLADYKWHIGICERLKAQNIDIQATTLNDFQLAQYLLDLPIKRVAYELKANFA